MLADPSGAPATEQPSSAGNGPEGNGSVPDGPVGPTDSPAAAPQATCPNCGAQLGAGQDWCLECGLGRPGSLEAAGPGWRSATTVLAVTAALVLGAGAAAYAALSKGGPHKAAPKVVTVAQAPPATGPPSTTTPGAATPGTATSPGGLGTPTTIKPLRGTSKAPKTPLTAAAPKPAEATTPTTGSGSTGSGTGTSESTTKSSGGTTTAEQTPTAILLDNNSASTYNPYGYPAGEFGDPRLAIDGEAPTAWTAKVNPAVAPRMAEGLLIDLKTAQKVSALTLITSTPGMTIEVYGANGHTVPGSITDPGWTPLSSAQDAKKRTTHIKLRDNKAFRFVVLWISKAPASSVGTPQAPGRVSVNEVELFPPK